MLLRQGNTAIGNFLRLDTTDIKLLLILFTSDLFRRVASLMLETATSSMFLYEFSGSFLPYVFIITSFFMALGAVHFIRIKRLPSAAAGLTIILLAAISFLLYLLYISGYTIFATWALMVWKNVCVVISEITFLLVALKFCQYNWRSWRFSAILLTEAVALISSGLAVTVLVYFITPISLVLISSVLLLIAGFILYSLSPKVDKLHKISTTHTVEGTKNAPIQLWLVAAFFSMMGLFIVGSYIIEYVFYKAVFATYGAWLADMTAFFALYHVFVGVLVLLTVFAFRHYEWIRSLRCTVLTLPFFFFVGVMGCLTGSLWILTLSRIGKGIIYKMVMTPTAKFFSVPLLPGLARRLSALRRIIIEPAGILLAGILLLYLEDYYKTGELPDILLLIGVSVSLLSYLSYRLYTKVTRAALTNRYWWGGALFLEDKSLKEFINNEIINQDVESTIYYLRAIEVSNGVNSEEVFIYALNHSAYRVRLFAISRLEVMRVKQALPILLKMISSDSSTEVRSRALRAYCVIGGDEVFPKVIGYLKIPTLMEGGTIGLLKSGSEGAFIAAGKIAELLDSGNKEEKITAARIIGSAKVKEYYRPLLPLLKDKNTEVKKAAIIAAGKLRTTKLIGDLIEALSTPELREDAAEGILKMGARALPFLQDALKQENRISTEYRLISLVGRIGGVDACHILIGSLENVPHSLKLVILRILALPEYQFNTSGLDIFKDLLKKEQERGSWLFSCTSDIYDHTSKSKGATKDSLQILHSALCTELAQSKEIASLLKKLIDCFCEVVPSSLLSYSAAKHTKHKALPLTDRLADILAFAGSNLHEWTEASAIYCTGVLKDESLSAALLPTLDNSSCLVKQTSLWALGEILPPAKAKEIAKKYLKDPCDNVADLARFIVD